MRWSNTFSNAVIDALTDDKADVQTKMFEEDETPLPPFDIDAAIKAFNEYIDFHMDEPKVQDIILNKKTVSSTGIAKSEVPWVQELRFIALTKCGYQSESQVMNTTIARLCWDYQLWRQFNGKTQILSDDYITAHELVDKFNRGEITEEELFKS